MIFPTASRGQRHGMVLLEVIVALSIFTLVAFSLVMALDSSFDAARNRNKIDAVVRGLDNQLVLLHATPNLSTQDLPDDGSGILYHLTYEPEQLQDQKKQPVGGIFRATITAKWKSGAETEERSVSELIYQP